MHMDDIVRASQVQQCDGNSREEEEPCPLQESYWQRTTDAPAHWQLVNMDSVMHFVALHAFLAETDYIYFVASINGGFRSTQCSDFIRIPIIGDGTNSHSFHPSVG